MSDKPKFTPGPWQIAALGRSHLLKGADRFVIADLDEYERGSTQEKNAALIAAAPDMYEALKLAAFYHPDNVIFRAALAKAEGK